MANYTIKFIDYVGDKKVMVSVDGIGYPEISGVHLKQLIQSSDKPSKLNIINDLIKGKNEHFSDVILIEENNADVYTYFVNCYDKTVTCHKTNGGTRLTKKNQVEIPDEIKESKDEEDGQEVDR